MNNTDGETRQKRVDLGKLSRSVSHALRHEPWLYELELDDEGWASVESILVALRKEQPEWADLCEADLIRMIESSSKSRHEVKDGRIRAFYGHSIAGKLRKDTCSTTRHTFSWNCPRRGFTHQVVGAFANGSA